MFVFIFSAANNDIAKGFGYIVKEDGSYTFSLKSVELNNVLK